MSISFVKNHDTMLTLRQKFVKMLLPSIILSIASPAVIADMDVVYQWKYIDFLWENNTQKENAISSGQYDFTKIFTIDVDKSRDGRVFLTTPRQDGVPASLSIVSEKKGDGGPLLQPYPDWSWHNKGDCNGITSVYRVAIDRCNRMWVLDNGKYGADQICSPQLLAFNLHDNQLMERIKIPIDLSRNPNNASMGLLVTPAVETIGRNCESTWVYMADVDGRGLVIWNGREIWRLDDSVYSPDENVTNFTINGESFELADGVFGLALTPESDGQRFLYFRPLASLKQYFVSTENLHRSFTRPRQFIYRETGYTFPSQATAEAFSKDGILFFGLTKENAISCWNRRDAMSKKNVVQVAENKDTMQFPSGVKVANDELWVTTNRFQKIMTGTQDFNDINFRILKASIFKLVERTACQPSRQNYYGKRFYKKYGSY